MVRLGDKTKRALRIGAKVGGIGLALVGAKQSLGKKDDGGSNLRQLQSSDPNISRTTPPKLATATTSADPAFMRTVGESRAISATAGRERRASAPTARKLQSSTRELRSGASAFADLSSQMRQQQEAKSKSGLMRFMG